MFPGGQPPPQNPQEQYPQGQYPQEEYLQGPYPQGQVPQGQFPQGQFPQGQFPRGQFPQGQFPQEQHLQAQPLQEQSLQGQYPQGEYSEGWYPQGQYPDGPYQETQFLQGQNIQSGPLHQFTQQIGGPSHGQPLFHSTGIAPAAHPQPSGGFVYQPIPDWWYREPPPNTSPKWVDIADIEDAIKEGREQEVTHFDGVRCRFKTDVILSAMSQGRLFGEERIAPLLQQIARFQPGVPYWLFDVWGNMINDGKFKVPTSYGPHQSDDGDFCIRAVLKYNSIQELAMKISETNLKRNIFPSPMAIEFKRFPLVSCMLPVDFGQYASQWSREWEASDIRRALRHIIIDNNANMNNIFDIRCFGLGCFGTPVSSKQWDEAGIKLTKDCYIQHLFASDVRDWIENRQGKHIALFSQDPLYCNRIAEKVKEDFRMDVISDDSAFFRITRHTFVIDFCKVTNIRQIIMDNCEPGGPGAMICKTVLEGDTGMQYEGQSYPCDDVAMRNYWARRGAYDHWDQDPSCPAMYQYAAHAISTVLPDESGPFRTRSMYIRRKDQFQGEQKEPENSGKGKGRA